MTTEAARIRRQYDEVIAPHYDRDPQGVAGGAVDLAIEQLVEARGDAVGIGEPIDALDVGVGTGRFFRRLRATTSWRVRPHGLDASAEMIRIAEAEVEDLVASVGDGGALESHFAGRRFELVSTHFVTGYVPLPSVAPQVRGKLLPGGLWSFVGGTRRGFPGLRALAESRFFRLAFPTRGRRIDDHVINPDDTGEVTRVLEAAGFEVVAAETLRPPVAFRDFDRFLEFAYEGGWLTPLIEAVGLHRAGRLTRAVLNRNVFPRTDHHEIAVVLARRNG